MSISAYIVGGEKTYAEQFIHKAHKQGIEIEMVGHRDWDCGTRGSIPSCDIILVLKDVVNHRLRDWARAQARSLGIKFGEVSQKISVAIKDLEHLFNLDLSTEESTMTKSILDFSHDEDLQAIHDCFISNASAFLIDKSSLGSRAGAIKEMFSSFAVVALGNVNHVVPVKGSLRKVSNKTIKVHARKNWKRMLEVADTYKRALSSEEDTTELVSAIEQWATSMYLLGLTKQNLVRVTKMIFGYTLPDDLRIFAMSEDSKPQPQPQPQPTPVKETPVKVVEEDNLMTLNHDLAQQFLADPYAFLGDGFPTKKSLSKLSVSLDDFNSFFGSVKKALKERGRGLNNEDFAQVQEAKYRWVLALMETKTFHKVSHLQAYVRNVWDTRLSDKYIPSVTALISKELPLISSVEVPTPAIVEEVVASQYDVELGAMKLNLSEGASISINEMKADKINVGSGVHVAIEKIENDTFYGVKISR